MRNKNFGIIDEKYLFNWNELNEHEGDYYSAQGDDENYKTAESYINYLKEQINDLKIKNLNLKKENDILKQNSNNNNYPNTEGSIIYALELSGFGIWEMDLATGIILISDVASKIYGLDSPIKAMSLSEAQGLVYSGDSSENSIHLKNLVENGVPYKRDFRIKRASDNVIRWVRAEGGIVRGPAGIPAKVIGTIRDITESKNIRMALEKSEESHRIISDMISDFVYVIENPLGDSPSYNWINKGLIYVYGYSREEVTSYEGFLAIVYPEDREKLAANLKNLQAGKETITEYRLIDKIGGMRWVRDYTKPVFNATSKKVERLYGALQDITIPKSSEIALKNSHLKLRSIFDTIPGSICVVDSMMNIVDCNFNFLRLYGFQSKDNIISGNFSEVIKNQMLETEVSILKNVLTDGKPIIRISIENEIAGNRNIFKIITSPITDDNSEIIGAINVYSDITDLKHAETQLINLIGELSESKKTIEKQLAEINEMNRRLVKSQDELKRLNKDKDKLFSIIAHDLRNPLSNILNYTEILDSEPDTIGLHDLKQIHKVLHNSSKHMHKLLENLLEWSRSQTGGIEFKPVKFNLNEIIFDNVFLFQKPAQAKDIELVSVYSDKSYVFADYNMVDTIVRNLLSNAVKFTRCGGKVEVEISDEGIKYKVSVRDNGIGMNELEKNNLFSLDKTVSRSGTANEKGTGLGLLIIKEFIGLHGSSISVDSSPGIGSVFSFLLPKFEG